jgi:RNA polymerase sigma factor (sigma-70 family)
VAELLSEILARCTRGEESAAAELVRRFWPWAVDFAAALLGDAHLAEDAVQSAFVTALTRLDELKEPNAFAGWFRQIVRTQVNRIARRRSDLPVAELPPRVAGGSTPAEAAESHERRQLIVEAIASLPRKSAEAATLHYLDELDCREVARRLSIPTGTVKRRLHDAREKLRGRLRSQLPL